MKRSLQFRLFLFLLAVNCVIYFGGADIWEITHPVHGHEQLRAADVGGIGTAAPLHGVVFKVEAQGGAELQAGTDTAESAPPPPAPQDRGHWNVTLEPPEAAPYNGNWPEGIHYVVLYNGTAAEDTEAVEFLSP